MEKDLRGVPGPLGGWPPPPPAPQRSPRLRSVLLFPVTGQELSHLEGEFGFVYTAAWASVWKLCVHLERLESVLMLHTGGGEDCGREPSDCPENAVGVYRGPRYRRPRPTMAVT